MMRSLSTGTFIAMLCSLSISTHVVYAAQNPVAAPPQDRPAAVTEDPVKWHRDPFIGVIKKGDGLLAGKAGAPKPGAGMVKVEKIPEQDFQLQGIMQADKSFHALVNGRTVKSGDTISGVTIVEISRFKVVVRNDRKEKIIYDIYQGRIDRGKQ